MTISVFIRILTGTLLQVNFTGSLPLLQKEIQKIEPEFHPLTQDIVRIGVNEGEERNFYSVKEGDLLGLMISIPPIVIVKQSLITLGSGTVNYQQYVIYMYDRKGKLIFSQIFYHNYVTNRLTFHQINNIDEYNAFDFIFSSKPVWYHSIEFMLHHITFLNNKMIIDEIIRLWENKIIQHYSYKHPCER